ncbi:MAG: ribonuclease G, partial [Veillonella sp.]|nr:ribonuclease G [Veillonella sp.]
GRLRSDMEITVHPQVAACFTKQVLKDLEGELSRHIEVASDATMSVEGYSLLALNV